jgi:hypothetical protein
MLFTKNDDGVRIWITAVKGGKLQGGLAGSITVTVTDPDDSATTSPSVSAATQTGLYYADVAAGFFATNGLGHYVVVAEIDSGGLKDVIKDSLRVFEEDFDTIGGGSPTTVAAAVWDRLLTGATHNIATSAGKRLRQIQEEQGYEGGAVWVDVNNGTPGTVPFENGTVGNPVDSIADARTLAIALGLQKFEIASTNSIQLAANYDKYIFHGVHWNLDLNGQSIDSAAFFGAVVTGTGVAAGGLPHFMDSDIQIASLPKCHLHNTILANKLTLTETGFYHFDDCSSGRAGLSTPVVDFGAAVGASELNMRHYSGGIEIENMNGGDTMSLEGHGQLIINANCTGGTVAIRGHFMVTDNASGAVTLSEDARYDVQQVRDAMKLTPAVGAPSSGSVDEHLDTTETFTTLIKKMLINKLELADGSASNWILYDDDDTTPLLTFSVSDKDGLTITQATGVPSKRTRGI